MQTKPLFITGIGTYVGKTIVSAVLCQQLKADYWKPIQSGDLTCSDSDQISRLISNPKTVIHPEAFRLHKAASPHQSAKFEGLEIKPEDIVMPVTDNLLIIEGAGGLFVPISPSFMMVDLIKRFDAEVVLVTRNYLGCINHTLLSLHALATMNIPVKQVILNGYFHPDTRDVIIDQLPESTNWSHLPDIDMLTKSAIDTAPQQIMRFT